MADSNSTKQALSSALKELLEEQPFEKISISDICDKCHMNRKSFYYHFRDKFDLANWTFDTEFADLIRKNDVDITNYDGTFEERWKIIEAICGYFYENRCFYSRILPVEGQNSFSSHFREFIDPLLHMRMEAMFGQEDVPQLVYDSVTDGIIHSIERWLLDKQCIPVEEYIVSMRKMIQVASLTLKHLTEDDPQMPG